MPYKLLACGSNGNYQLGIGHNEDVDALMECQVSGLDEPKKVICGGNHTLLLTKSGQIFAVGDNRVGQCGLSLSVVEKFTLVPQMDGSKWVDAAAGWEYSILVNESNKVFCCGSGRNGELGLSQATESPYLTEVFKFDHRVTKIASSIHHTVVLLENGETFGWGNNKKGQLGFSKEQKVVWQPTRLSLSPVRDYSLARDFSVFLLTDGIRIAGKCSESLPDILENSYTSACQVHCMWTSAHVFVDGKVISAGNNSHGQLIPICSFPIKQVAIGSEHGLLLDGSNAVKSWGWGEHGNCGSQPGESVVYCRFSTLYSGPGKVCGIWGGCATSWVAIEV